MKRVHAEIPSLETQISRQVMTLNAFKETVSELTSVNPF